MSRTRPPTFSEAFERRQRVRKGGAPAPLPADLEPLLTQFLVDWRAGLKAAIDDEAEDRTADTLTAAMREAAAQIVVKALGTLYDAARQQEGEGDMDKIAKDYANTGGVTWDKIERLAAERVAKTAGAGAMTRAEKAAAIDAFLKTPDGARLYDAYLAEQQAVITRQPF